MAETVKRQTALADLPLPVGNDGLGVEDRDGLTQLQVIARKGQVDALAGSISKFLKRDKMLSPLEGARRGGVFICAVGPGEFWAVIERHDAAKERKELERIAGGRASLFDQTDGRFVIRLSGPNAIDVLARGTSLNLRDTALPMELGANTAIEHIPAIVLRREEKQETVFDVSVPRSYAGSFMAWLRGD